MTISVTLKKICIAKIVVKLLLVASSQLCFLYAYIT